MADASLKGGETYRAGQIRLGARLLAAAGLVRPGVAVADIGCDHGKLSVWLAQGGAVPKVVAVDNRPMPLARAKALAGRCGCAHVVHCRLGDGLQAVAPGEVQDIVIAGMSGETIERILQPYEWIRAGAVRLILVPATRHPQLRRFLCLSGFELETEVPVLDAGRSYTVMAARYTGKACTPTPLFCHLGLMADMDGAAAQTYKEARLAHLRKMGAAPMDEAGRVAHEKLIQEVEGCLR